MPLTTFTGIDAICGGWIRGIRQTDWTLGADSNAAILTHTRVTVQPPPPFCADKQNPLNAQLTASVIRSTTMAERSA